uniref:Uncharacterized protein n=1 Tax=Grammatophora oceanica TaxID=210454 RepID=A0A7S1UQQ9_9STRA|mmetsp:Transcript_15196/g.22282  ORF Transcript_15196/g.22282 Transcript_15196/m.22282 type:complete len:407 (+) Transcript_15196:131-1351(+)|eukprot:CAMPEP_0194032734 /NCGR_PEP_ID=MMETSP0009_2-20130614/5610_1 /TAXON_ID=210454 /ORGANISM="Grammatophora oceanica, Strain CCMP 410" /LENGTH=406 /DNA_ID=CAMNT_0038673261 /DNA_START=93 /DNA_END=1313 /DNA_ORIENTATION=+
MRFSTASVLVLANLSVGTVVGFKANNPRFASSRQTTSGTSFTAPSAPFCVADQHTTKLNAYRQAYQFQLDQMTAGEIETQIVDIDKEIAQAKQEEDDANSKVGMLEEQLATLQTEHEIAVDKLKEDMEDDHVKLVEAQEAANKVGDTVSMLEMELRLKEQEKRTVVKQLKDQMKTQASELKQQMNDLGDNMAHMKIDFQHEKMAIEQDYKKHDEELHHELEALEEKLAQERKQANKAAAAVQAVRDEMKSKEKELKQRINAMGSDMTNMKIEVNQEKIALMDEYKQRENDFVSKVNALASQLEVERENAGTAKELSQGLTISRIELESELVVMKRKYAAEKWRREFDNTQAQEEIEALKARMADADQVAADAEKMKEEIAALKSERKNPMALFRQGFMALAGQAEE